jgi:hypothetical protein
MCPQGKYNSGGATCFACSTGSFANETGLTACFPCSIGSYQDLEQMSSCTLWSVSAPFSCCSVLSTCSLTIFLPVEMERTPIFLGRDSAPLAQKEEHKLKPARAPVLYVRKGNTVLLKDLLCALSVRSVFCVLFTLVSFRFLEVFCCFCVFLSNSFSVFSDG